MDRPMEGGSLRPEGGQYERRMINDVVLVDGRQPPYVDRDHWIDYAIQSGVDFERLPRMPLWATAAGYSDAWYRSVVGSDLKRIRYLAQRPLAQEEAQHLAQHTANKCRATTHYTPMWMSATGYFWWKGWNSYRFPFYTPNPRSLEWVSRRLFSPVGIKSVYAPFIWHALRLISYSSISSWGMSIFFKTGPSAIFAAGLINDKNLEGLNKDIAHFANERRRQQRAGMPTGPVGQPQMSTMGGEDEPPAVPEQGDQGAAEFEQLQRQARPEDETLQRKVPAPARMPSRRRAEPEPQYNADDDDPFDDASPVAPSARQQKLDASTPVGGSAWTRLRTKAFVERTQEQANEGSAALPRTSSWEERRQQSLQGGSYTYSQERPTGDDKGSAAAARSREQAQKEFDAMLERERKGSS
ncbi:hypothetical protein V8F06_000572 [Rhypophila decipiens]